VPIARRLATGKIECPPCKRTALELNKITPGKKTEWQPELEVQELICIAGIESD
jgi:hypothetical protein